MPNRLSNETSPYLLQHANNPVDWYAWNNEALEKAKQEGKPIFLSIGYSACHWCHVMEKESFENPDIARLMNQNFINIKVDREERPDLDSIYMQAVQAMTGRGGWPLSVFLTPDTKPFYGGTYFPPSDRRDIPGFPRILSAISEAFNTKLDEVSKSASDLMERMEKSIQTQPNHSLLESEVIDNAYLNLSENFDTDHGGFSPAPKFPQPMIPEFVLRYHHRTGQDKALAMVELTLEKMALGGIYDQIGGGFHRYSTDDQWMVPHFEKMLYDNALLARLYLHAYQVTGKPLYKRITEEILDYILRDMTDPEGGFYSAEDADSEGQEGKYYVWSHEEILQELGLEEGNLFCVYYGVTPQGNFDGHNIMHVARSLDVVAREVSMKPNSLLEVVTRSKQKLLEARYGRTAPSKDQKVITAWNGLMITSFSEASAVLQRKDYQRASENCALFILKNLSHNGRILRTFKDGKARLKGYLEDYSCLADGLISLHEATLDPKWLAEANLITDRMIDLFWDKESSIFYDTGRDHEHLVIRPRDIFDNAMPCGGSTAVNVLLRMGLYTNKSNYTNIAVETLSHIASWITSHPQGFGQWLIALDFHLGTHKEIALVGDLNNAATVGLLNVIHSNFLPNKVLVGKKDGDTSCLIQCPLLAGKGLLNGKPTAYVCQDNVCKEPVTEPQVLFEQLVGSLASDYDVP